MDSHLFCDTDCFSLQEMIERDMRSPFDPVLGVVQDLDPADCDDGYCDFPPNRTSLQCVVNDQDSVDSFDNLQLRAGTSHFTWFPGSATATVSVSDVENSVCATTVIVNPHAAMPQLQPQSSSLLKSKSTSSSSSSSSSSSEAPCVEDNLVTVANRNALAEALASVARHHRQHKRQKVQHRRRHSDVTEDDSDSSPPPTPRIKAPSSARVKREPKSKVRKLEGGADTYGGGVVSGVPGTRDDVNGRPYPKPTYSYSCLIAMALKNSSTGCLPVSEIYSFMTENFPYFRTAPHGWKNSVRHNLSLNKCFEKIEKPAASSGTNNNGTNKKGCLWTMNPDKIGKMEEEMQKWSRKDPMAIKLSMACPENLDTLEKGFRHCVPIKSRKKAMRPSPKVETITLKHEEIDVTIPEESFKSGLWDDLEDESLTYCPKVDSDPEDVHITVSKSVVGGNNQRNIYSRVLTHGTSSGASVLPLLN